MSKMLIFLNALSLFLVACHVEAPQSINVEPAVTNAQNQVNMTAGDAAIKPEVSSDLATCPSKDFELFLKTFSESSKVQEAFTEAPLQIVTIDSASEPEPEEVLKVINREELSFPLMPNLAVQANDGLKSRRSSADENNFEVILFKPDTDYQMSFFFKRLNCWKLYRIKDHSL